MEQYAKTAEGAMQPANDIDLLKDRLGFTNPNLHRRIVTDDYANTAKYVAGVYDKQHSMRTTDRSTHDEESTTCEIP